MLILEFERRRNWRFAGFKPQSEFRLFDVAICISGWFLTCERS